jgi:hypothetical protein
MMLPSFLIAACGQRNKKERKPRMQKDTPTYKMPISIWISISLLSKYLQYQDH